jgi:hypothetical protein
MNKTVATIAAALALAPAASAANRIPPGALQTTRASAACSDAWVAAHNRPITRAQQAAVRKRDGTEKWVGGVIRRRVPVSLGGATRVPNLAWMTRAAARRKARSDKALVSSVCGSITSRRKSLRAAQMAAWEWKDFAPCLGYASRQSPPYVFCSTLRGVTQPGH